MIFTNEQIYNYANNLLINFSDTSLVLPIKVNFYLQKNKKLLIEKAQEIEEYRIGIIQKHGHLKEGSFSEYQINEGEQEEVNKELSDLFSLEQNIDIMMVHFKDIPENISLTTGQMEAIIFMID